MNEDVIITKSLRINNARDLNEVRFRVREELGISDAEIRYLKEFWLAEVRGIYQGASAVLHVKLIDGSYVASLLFPPILARLIDQTLGVSDAKIWSSGETIACDMKHQRSWVTLSYSVRWSSEGMEREGSFSIVEESLYSAEDPEEYLRIMIASMQNS